MKKNLSYDVMRLQKVKNKPRKQVPLYIHLVQRTQIELN